MNKFFQMLEDLWVAVTFAEAGIYEHEKKQELELRCHDTARAHGV